VPLLVGFSLSLAYALKELLTIVHSPTGAENLRNNSFVEIEPKFATIQRRSTRLAAEVMSGTFASNHPIWGRIKNTSALISTSSH
jgi:hypothetical protein